MHLMASGGFPVYVVAISADAANQNLKTLAGSPAGVCQIIATINAGVQVYSTNTATPALRTGGLAAGSKVKIINNGYIYGCGGAGGAGGDGGSKTAGAAGGAGGDALQLDDNTDVDNAGGYIFGGAGGGGGGGYAPGHLGVDFGGGGGGGGMGRNGGAAGAGGVGLGGAGSNGTAGTTSAPGSGGDSGRHEPPPDGWGGIGGDWGSSGYAGGAAGSAGGAAGVAGKAANLNGKAITWLAGNNSSQIKGAVA
jgi:hypothetical protein